MLEGWSEETVGGHPCDLYEPPERCSPGYVLIYLHGVHLGRLVDKAAFTEQFARRGLPVVAPMTGPTWWTDRRCSAFDPEISPERHLLDRVLPFVAEQYGARPPQIGLFGTSMGGQGALRIAYKHPDKFPVAAGVAPAIDYHLRMREGDEHLEEMYRDDEQARQDTALLHIHPLNWPRHQFFCCDPEDHRWYDGVDRLRMKLASLGVPFECDLDTTVGGHGFDYYNTMAEKVADFLYERLEAERRRVV